MTQILNLEFPNTSIASLEKDVSLYDTEVVESMSGLSFRNARRTLPKRLYRMTLWGEISRTDIQLALSIKGQAKGRLYGFKFTDPLTNELLDVAFAADDWTVKIEPGADDTGHIATIDVALEEVIDGVPFA